jgi:hypothetical protein
VSAHQGEIDWERVAGDGIEIAYIKATEGPRLGGRAVRREMGRRGGGRGWTGVPTTSSHCARPATSRPATSCATFVCMVEQAWGRELLFYIRPDWDDRYRTRTDLRGGRRSEGILNADERAKISLDATPRNLNRLRSLLAGLTLTQRKPCMLSSCP